MKPQTIAIVIAAVGSVSGLSVAYVSRHHCTDLAPWVRAVIACRPPCRTPECEAEAEARGCHECER